MSLLLVGCSHHASSLEVRERVAFSQEQARDALDKWRSRFPDSEAVLLSTCNRVELYVATDTDDLCDRDLASFIADYHGLEASRLWDALFHYTGEDAVRHLFMVAASLDSMVVGEAQILYQVKQAYEMARAGDHAGTRLHLAFQAASRTARRVASETAIHQKRVSIPSVAVSDFASQIFERFDDKRVLIAGAGEMAEETLQYLRDAGARDITIINRNRQRAELLAQKMGASVAEWETLFDQLAQADVVVSATGATQPLVTRDAFAQIARRRQERPLFILDLAVPRDFDPEIGRFNDVYLYSIDHLQKACDRNLRQRRKEWPHAQRIVEEETRRFMADLKHRATAPTIQRLTALAQDIKQDELGRLLNKLPELDERQQREVQRAFDRLINKLLHPPLDSLRSEAEEESKQTLIHALRRLFQLGD